MTRERRTFRVLGFASTHDALEAEAVLGDLGIEVTPIPAPAAMSAQCGIALRFPPDQEERVLRYLDAVGIEPAGCSTIEDW